MTKMLAALTLLALVAAVPVVAEEEPGSPGCAAYWPLGAGTVWVYDFHGHGGVVELRREVLGETDGCVELRCRQGQRDFYDYVSTRDGVVAQLANASLGGERGVSETRRARPLLRGPVAVGTSWTWVTHGSVQTAGGGSGPPAEALRIDSHATIEATDDVVTVPAGRFEAVRVRVVTRSAFFGDGETVTWWVEGVGPVKVVERERDAEYVTELRRLTRP